MTYMIVRDEKIGKIVVFEVEWIDGKEELPYPTIAEIVEAAGKEFPETPFNQLVVACSEYHGKEFISIGKKMKKE